MFYAIILLIILYFIKSRFRSPGYFYNTSAVFKYRQKVYRKTDEYKNIPSDFREAFERQEKIGFWVLKALYLFTLGLRRLIKLTKFYCFCYVIFLCINYAKMLGPFKFLQSRI